MGINVGIDLGTTYSAIAVFDDATGQVRILKNSGGMNCTPSVTHIENGKVKIGDEAKQLQGSGDLNAAAFYKSMMGEKGYMLYLDGKEYSPEELSGLYLRELIRDVSRHNNVQIDGAVITCPAYFNEAQRLATLNAGKAAGLKVLKVINEPTAAIIAYGLTGAGKKNVMVYDLGGGTFDVTIAEVDGTKVKVLTTNGNHQLGGKNWDAVIADELKQRFFDEYNANIEDNPEDYYQLRVQCEKIKRQLTDFSSTKAHVQSQGYTGKYEITRVFFDSATYSLLNETSLLVDRCFSEIGGGFSWKNLDEVVLVGGSTRMPQVKEFVRREYGRELVTKNIDVDTIVAAGAAMQAKLCVENRLVLGGASAGTRPAALDGSEKKRLVITGGDIQDITSHSLGMLALSKDETAYKNSIIIKKNSSLNTEFGKEYNFGGTQMDAFVLQGESEEPRDCTLLYKYCVSGFVKGQKTDFSLYFIYNQDGVVDVRVEAKDRTPLLVEKSVVNETIDEIINRLLREREEQKRKASRAEIMFMVDTSGSMSGEPIQLAREAIRDFVRQLDLSRFTVSIVNFAESSRFECSNASDSRQIERATSALETDTCGVGTS
ncbi:MAG: Hsp70 family protein, partial [Treponema sp.]|nr:Hsp70 family protein [Treponema sp.]